MLKQKLYGLALIVLSIICGILLEGDMTISVILIPMGLYLIFSEEYWLND